MTGIVLVTHTGLGESLRHQAEVILGHMIPMTTVSISYGADPDSALIELIGGAGDQRRQWRHGRADGSAGCHTAQPGQPGSPATRHTGYFGRESADVAQGRQPRRKKPANELAALASLGGHQGIINS